MRERQQKDTNKLYPCPSFIETKNMILVINANFYIFIFLYVQDLC